MRPMMKRRNLDNSKGFTLVEIMIALGIMSGLILAVSQMISTGQKGAKKISQDIEQSSLSNTIINTMRDKLSCERTLEGISLNTAAGATLANYAAGAPVLVINKVAGGAVIPIAETSTGSGINATKIYGAGTNGAIYIEGMYVVGYVAGSTTSPGIATLRIVFRRVTNGSNTNTPVYRDISLIIYDKNGDGTFSAAGGDICYTDAKFLQDAACSVLGGQMNDPMGRCERLNIYSETGTTNPAITLNGDLMVNSVTNGGASEAGKITATSDIATNSGQLILNSPNGLVRLGNNPSSLEIAAGATSGAGANLKLNTNGTATFNANSTQNGTATINGATTINGVTTVTGATSITGNTSITSGANKIVLTSAASGTTVTGPATFASGDVNVSNGFIYLNKSASQIGAPSPVAGSVDGTKVVTKDWVFNMLANNAASQLSPAQKDAIVAYVMAQSANVGWLTLKSAIIGNIQLPSSPCGANQFVKSISWAPSGVSTAYSNLTYTCGNMTVNNCSVSGTCGTVYSQGTFCSNATGVCLSNQKYNVWGACMWGGGGSWPDASTGYNVSFCPVNYFAAGTGWQGSYAIPFCCPSANR